MKAKKKDSRNEGVLDCKQCDKPGKFVYETTYHMINGIQQRREGVHIFCNSCGYYYWSESMVDPNKELVEIED